MPKMTVQGAFAKRGLKIGTATPEQFYSVACWLGVGYTSLIWHMNLTLNLIGREQAKKLMAVKVKEIKRSIFNFEAGSELLVVDERWHGRPVDVRIDDIVLAPLGTCAEGDTLEVETEDVDRVVLRAVRPGSLGRLVHPSWSSFVRVSRREYVGRSIFRHLEEEDE